MFTFLFISYIGGRGRGKGKLANIPLPSIVPKAETMEVEENVSEMFAPSSPMQNNRDEGDDEQSAHDGGTGDFNAEVEIDEVREDKNWYVIQLLCKS